MLKPSDCARTSTSCTFSRNGEPFGKDEILAVDMLSASPVSIEEVIVLKFTFKDGII